MLLVVHTWMKTEMEVFSWFGQILDAVGTLIPRRLIIRATQGGVKWTGKRVKALKPGFHWYWPVITEVEVIVTARQTLNLPPQTLMTQDRVKLAVSAVIVYSVYDVVRAIGEVNWDVTGTASDIAQAAVVEVISSTAFCDVSSGVTGEIEKRLTSTARRRLNRYGVRVHRCALTDLAECRVVRLIQNDVTK